MPHVACCICQEVFYAKPRHIQRGWGKYCSRHCQHKGQHRGKQYECGVCKMELYRTPAELRKSRSGNFFCNKSCLAVWKNTNAPKGEGHFNWKDGSSAYRAIMKKSGVTPKCSKCKLKNINVLVVHHIDQNRKNNNVSNLCWLCRNCHYLVHNGKTV